MPYVNDIYDVATRESPITQCENGSYCCGNGTLGDACCKEGKGLFILSGTAVSVTATSSSTKPNLSPSSTKPNLFPSSAKPTQSLSSQNALSQTIKTFANTAVPQGSSTFTAPASPPSSSFASASPSDQTGVVVGGVIGGVAVLAFFIGFVVWTWMHSNRRNSRNHEMTQTASIDPIDSEQDMVFNNNNNSFYELNAPSPRAELEHRPIAELEPVSIAELEHQIALHER